MKIEITRHQERAFKTNLLYIVYGPGKHLKHGFEFWIWRWKIWKGEFD